MFHKQLWLRDINDLLIITVFCTTNRQKAIDKVTVLLCNIVNILPTIVVLLRSRQHFKIAHDYHALFGA